MVKPISPELAEQVIRGKFLHCKDIHDHTCEYEAIERFFKVMNIAWKFYLPIHSIPTLIFHYRLITKAPHKFLFKLGKNVFWSCMFLSSYIALFRYGLCFFKNARGKVDRRVVIYSGIISGLGLLWEPQGRRTELALYFLPRFIEAFWAWCKKRNWVTPIPYGEVILFAIAMGIMMYCYQNEERNIKKTYLSIFKFFWGEN